MYTSSGCSPGHLLVSAIKKKQRGCEKAKAAYRKKTIKTANHLIYTFKMVLLYEPADDTQLTLILLPAVVGLPFFSALRFSENRARMKGLTKRIKPGRNDVKEEYNIRNTDRNVLNRVSLLQTRVT